MTVTRAPTGQDLVCLVCRKPAQDIDHVVNRGMGGSKARDVPENKVPLCRECHGLKTTGRIETWVNTGDLGDGVRRFYEWRKADSDLVITVPVEISPRYKCLVLSDGAEEGNAPPQGAVDSPSASAPSRSAGLSHEQRGAVAQDGIPGTITETSLQLPEGLPLERWVSIGETLANMDRSVGWWLGDWAIYGEGRYEEWSQVVDSLGLDRDTAQKYIYVASNVRIRIRIPNLSFSHHRLVAPLSESEQHKWLARAVKHDWKWGELRRRLLLAEDAERIKTLPTIAGTFTTIVADPPWPYQDSATRGAAEDHYDTMEIDAICELEISERRVRDLAPAHGAHLYLWVPGMHLREGWALRVVRAWGFEPATMLTWVKPQMGIGKWFRSASEYVLFCTRDGLPLTVQDKAYRNWFEADRGKHSQKPDAFYKLVQTVSPGPYLDLFGRTQREGWEVWGDEA